MSKTCGENTTQEFMTSGKISKNLKNKIKKAQKCAFSFVHC